MAIATLLDETTPRKGLRIGPGKRAKRNRLAIISAILKLAEKEENFTTIMYKVSLGYSYAKSIFDFLTDYGLLESSGSGSRKKYRTTAKGRELIRVYGNLLSLLDEKKQGLETSEINSSSIVDAKVAEPKFAW